MDALATAEKCLDDGNPTAAIKHLLPFYKTNRLDDRVNQIIVDSFIALQQWNKAKAVITHNIKSEPEVASHWIKLSKLYLEQDEPIDALRVLNKATKQLSQSLELHLTKAQVLYTLNQTSKMHDWFEHLFSLFPEQKAEMLVERAQLYQRIAQSPSDNEDKIRDPQGNDFAIRPLKLAHHDLSQALKISAKQWQWWYQRAKVNQQLQNFESAVNDYQLALKCLSESQTDQIEFIRQQIQICRTGDKAVVPSSSHQEHQPSKTHSAPVTSPVEIDNELNSSDQRNQIDDDEDWYALIEEIGDDQSKQTALTIAQEIINTTIEPEYNFKPTDNELYSSQQNKFCEKVEQSLARFDFSYVGDFEPKGLLAKLKQPTLVRIFLSSNFQHVATCCSLARKDSSFKDWLTSLVTRKSGAKEIIEFTSFTSEGHSFITNNDLGNTVYTACSKMTHLLQQAPSASPDSIFEAHLNLLSSQSVTDLIRFNDTDSILKQLEKLRQHKNSFRQSINYVTDEELTELLQDQPKNLQPLVRRYLTRLTQSISNKNN